MKYDVYVEDVEGEHLDTKIEAATPREALPKIAEWCKSENLLPKHVSIYADGALDREEDFYNDLASLNETGENDG